MCWVKPKEDNSPSFVYVIILPKQQKTCFRNPKSIQCHQYEIFCFFERMSRLSVLRDTLWRENIIRFVVWATLVIGCVLYLQAKPAERQAIKTWFSVLFDNIQILTARVTGWPRQAYENKLQYEMRIDELANVAEISQWCLPRDTYENIKQLEYDIHTMDIETYMQKSLEINVDIIQYKWALDEYCSRE